MRITNNMLIRNMMLNINTNLMRLDKVQYQMSTGKKIGKPSDDPIIASRALKYRTDIYEIEQFKKNASDAISWIEMTEQALSNLSDVLKRARELTVQAASDSVTPEDKIKIQSEITQLKKSIIEIGNTSYAGRYIFGGYDTDKPPFAIENTSIGEKITYRGKFLSLGGPVSGTVSDEDIQDFYRNNLDKVAGQPELMMGNLLSFDVFTSGAGADFNITLTEGTNEITRTIRIPEGSYDTGNINELVSALQAAIDDDTNGFGTFTLDGQAVSKIKVGTDSAGQKIVFTVQNGDAIQINKTPKQNGLDIEKIGFEDGARSRQVSDNTYQLTMNFMDFTATPTESRFDIVLDSGQVLEIDLPAGDYTLDDMVAELNNQLDGTSISVSAVDGKIRFESTMEGFTIRENGYALELSRLGYVDGVKSARNQLQSIEYEVGVGNKVKVNLEGSEVFSEIGGLEGLFETFRKLEMALNGETAYKTARMDADTGTVVVETHTMKVDDMLADFDKDLDRLLKVRSDMGARLNYLELTDNRLRDDYINFTSLKSKNEDVDLAEVIMQLKIEENVYRASLAAGARIIQPTLLDFLR